MSGGTLRADARCYVHREADEVLFRSLCAGEYCYVLTSRQMGKSSLMVRTALRLREAGITPVLLDLTALGQNLTPDQWYRSLLDMVGEQLALEDELEAFWESHLHVGPIRRFVEALIQVVLPLLQDKDSGQRAEVSRQTVEGSGRKLVLFIDEIDTVQALPFCTDEFFAAIRECHNRRSDTPLLEGLTFCLLGVATPSDLIRDPRTTPFNIGRRVELTDFRSAEAALLAHGLEPLRLDPAAVLKRVLHWTGGHPYLTQRFCQALVEQGGVQNLRDVDAACEALFLSKQARLRDNNLLFVREQVLRSQLADRSLEETRSAALDLYLQVWRGRKVAEDPADPVTGLLRLAGLVRSERGRLYPRNRIYTRVFDGEWVQSQLPEAEVLRQRTAFLRGVRRTASVAGVVLVVVGGLAVSLVVTLKEKDAALSRLRLTLGNLERQTARAEQEAHRAEQAGRRAALGERLAEQRRAETERERQGARALQQIAESARDQAQWRLAQMHLTEGWRKIEEAQPAIGLLWFVEALKLLEGKAAEEQRVLIATLLRLTPHPRLTWSHSGQVQFARFSPDGSRVLTAANNGSIEVRNVETGERVGKALCGIGLPRDASIQQGGVVRVVCVQGKEARVWDARRGLPVSPPLRHPAGVTYAAFSPDGRHITTSCDDGMARVWDAYTGASVVPPLRHEASVWHCTYTPDGKKLLTQDANRQLFLWELGTASSSRRRHLGAAETWGICAATGALVAGMRGTERSVLLHSLRTQGAVAQPLDHHGTIFQAAFSPDGRWVATAGSDHFARVWSTATRRRVSVLPRHTAPVAGVTFGPYASQLVTTSVDRTARVWSTSTGVPLSPPLPHGGPVLTSVFAPNGQHLVTLGKDGLVRLWDLATVDRAAAEVYSREEEQVTSLHPDRDRWITAGPLGAGIWKISDGTAIASGLPHADPEHFALPQLSPDGRRLVTRSHKPAGLHFWQKDGRLTTGRNSELHRYYVLAVDPTGQLMAAGTGGGGIEVRRMRDTELITLIRRNGPVLRDLCFSPDGKLLLASDAEGKARLWSAHSGKPAAPPLSHLADIRFGQFSPDGRWVATGSEGSKAQVWETATGHPVTRPLPHEAVVTSLRFHPTGKTLATAGRDRVARVWRLPEGTRLGSAMHHRETITDLAFSPDGQWLATGSEDGTVRVWDARTGRPITPYLPVGEGVSRVAFGLDGKKLYVGTDKGAVQTWNLNPDNRSVSDLKRLAWYLSGHQLNAAGGLVPLEADTLARLSRELREFSPSPLRSGTPQVLAWHRREAAVAERDGMWVAAARHLDPLLKEYPTSRWLRVRRAHARSEAELWSGAAEDWMRLRKREPHDPIFWYQEALCRLGADDLGGYRATCRGMLRQFEDASDPRSRDLTAWTCALGDCSPDARARALALVEDLLKGQPEHENHLNTRGLLLYRAGRHHEAHVTLQRAIRLRGENGSPVDRLFSARAQARLGDTRALAGAREDVEEEASRLVAALKSAWADRLEMRLFLREPD